MIALPTPLPSSAWWVTMLLDPKSIRGGKWGKARCQVGKQRNDVCVLTGPYHQRYPGDLRGPCLQNQGISVQKRAISVLVGRRKKPRGLHTLYRLPSAPTEHPSSRYPIFFTIAAIPHELSRAARRPISLARALKNCRSANVVSRAKKCVNMPMIMRSSSVGSLPR